MIDHRLLGRTGITALFLSALACGSSNNGGPSQCDPEFTKTAGDGQSGEVSLPLPDTLVVRATTCDPSNLQGPQLPEPGVSIVWLVTGGGGTVNGVALDTVSTDANGLARAAWVLGPTEGAQTVSATALRSAPDVASFTATATAPALGCPVGSTVHAGGFFTIDETWGPGGHVLNGQISFGGGATLTLAAGAHVCLEGIGIEFTEQSHLAVQGTAGNPVTIESGSLTFGVNISALTTPSTISNARLESATISVSGGFHPVVVESTLVRDGEVVLGAPGSGFSHSTIVRGRLTVHGLNGGPIVVEATVRDASTEGIFINGSGVTLIRCEVTGCATDGVLSAGDATTISVTSSNFSGNSGVGVRNGDLGSLNATGNWWGDPGGPNGPNGDGVAGNVDVSGALAAPAILGYRPPE